MVQFLARPAGLVIGILISLSLSAQIQFNLPTLEAEVISHIEFDILDFDTTFCTPGVRNRSQSRGVLVRYERQGSFDWSMANDRLEGTEQRVNLLEQFTFKFKVPILNRPGLKALIGYEWDTEKYYFNRLTPIPQNRPPTMWQLLNERRLKVTKLSAYVTKSWNERFYSLVRVRLSLSGDYDGLVDFGKDYRTYSGAIGFGKKVNRDTEWGVGLTFSSNRARTVAVPFFVYNKTWNRSWGLESALPGQIFLRHNIRGEKNAFLLGATFDSRFYAINSTGDADRFPEFGRFFLRTNGVRTQLHYERGLMPWVWAYAQGGVYFPVNARFNPLTDVETDLQSDMSSRPFLQIGIFLAPPRELIR